MFIAWVQQYVSQSNALNTCCLLKCPFSFVLLNLLNAKELHYTAYTRLKVKIYIGYIFSIPRFWLQKKKIQAIGFMIQLCIHRGAVNTFLVLVFINEWPPQLMRFMKTGFDSCSRRSMWLLFVLFHVLFFIHFHAVLNRHTTPNSFSLNVYAAMCSSCVSMLL